MAVQLKEKMGHRRKVTILGICCIGSLLVALITYGLLWTKIFGFIHWPGISSYVALAVMLGSFLSFCVCSIWLVIELTKYRSWSHRMMVGCRIMLILLLLVCYAGLGMLAVWHAASQMVQGCDCIIVDPENADGEAPGGKFDYIYDNNGDKLIDQNGNVVQLYFQYDSSGGYHLVIDDSSGRLVGHNKEDPLVEDVFFDPFAMKEENNTNE